MDIQMVLELYVCAEYLVKYAAKAEKPSANFLATFTKILQYSNQDTNPAKILRNLFVKSIGERDIGHPEACRIVRGGAFHLTNLKFLSLNLDLNSRKVTRRENALIREEKLTDYYAKRLDPKFSNQLEIPFEISLIDFTGRYMLRKVEGVHKLCERPNQENVVVQAFPTLQANPNSPLYSKYCMFAFIRYRFWTAEAEADLNRLMDETTAVDRWERFCSSLTQEQQSTIQSFESLGRLMTLALHDILAQEPEQEEEETVTHEEWQQVASSVTMDSNQSNSNDEWNVADRQQLVEQQVFKLTDGQIEQGDTWIRTNANDPGIREIPFVDRTSLNVLQPSIESGMQTNMIVVGEGGTGKSQVINAISSNAAPERVKRCAFKGLAAHNIMGVTLHSLLKLPTKTDNFQLLSENSCKVLELDLKGVRLIIIDEFSMLGKAMLGMVEIRLRQIFDEDLLLFGGISICLVGDINQLPPVGAGPLYTEENLTPLAEAGRQAYFSIENVFILTDSKRQIVIGDDPEQMWYLTFLKELRIGNVLEDDWKHLLQYYSIPKIPNFNERFKYAIYLIQTNKEVDRFNKRCLERIGAPIARLVASNTPKSARRNQSGDRFQGLEQNLYLSRSI